MTAEEFLGQEQYYAVTSGDIDEIINAMVNFAQHHVELALKEALKSIPCLGSSSDIATYVEVEKAVLNSYNLNNIK